MCLIPTSSRDNTPHTEKLLFFCNFEKWLDLILSSTFSRVQLWVKHLKLSCDYQKNSSVIAKNVLCQVTLTFDQILVNFCCNCTFVPSVTKHLPESQE